MQKILIVGGSGQLGSELHGMLQASAGGYDVVRSSREARNGYLTFDPSSLRSPADAAKPLDPLQPECIVFAGAMTHVDGCEAEPEQAFRANAHGPAMLASYARARRASFVYISSDYIFDGSAEHPGPYAEDAKAMPLSVYGQSKWQGERAVLRVHPQSLVIRTSWVYGPDAAGKNFVHNLLRHLRSGQPMRVPSDQISTPTYNRDLAEATAVLLEAGATGTVHVAGPELMSRAEMARVIATHLRLDSSLIQATATAALGQVAPRPLRSGLVSKRLGRDLPAVRLRTLPEALAEGDWAATPAYA